MAGKHSHTIIIEIKNLRRRKYEMEGAGMISFLKTVAKIPVIGILLLPRLASAQFQMMEKFNSGTPVFEKNTIIIPVDLRGHNIYVKAKVNNSEKEFNFILDTGAMTAIDDRLATELNIEKGTELPTELEGKKSFLTKYGITIGLGCMTVKDFIVVMTDLPEASQLDPSIDGFIGSDFLRFFQVTIDYRQNSIVLSHGNDLSDSTAGAYVIDIQTQFPFRFPLVTCRINEELEAQAMLDTGSPFSVVSPLSLVEKQKFSTDNKPIKSKGLMAKWPFTSPDHNYLARVKSIRIGALGISNIPVIYAELPMNLSYLLLGKDFLSQFLITINYPKNKLFLLPHMHSVFKNNVYSIGLSLMKDDSNKTVVQGFWDGSPADSSNIKVYDEVLELNSRASRGLTMREINNILNNDTVKTVELVMRGHQGEKKLALRKRLLFPKINDQCFPR